MKITVSRENYTIKNDFIKLAEFYDTYHPALFVKALIDEAVENGDTNIKVEVEGPEEE